MLDNIKIPILDSWIDGVLQYSNSSEALPMVLFIHGLTSSNSGYIEIGKKLLDESNINSLCISLRGHGKSDGNFSKLTFNDSFVDVESAINYLFHQSQLSISSFGIQGTSIGAALGVMATTKYKVDSIVLRVPAMYTLEMNHKPYSEIMARESAWFSELDPNQTPQVEAIAKYQQPLLVIKSENDAVIPNKITDTYINNCPAKNKQLSVILNATHNLADNNWRQQYINLTCNWFKQTLF